MFSPRQSTWLAVQVLFSMQKGAWCFVRLPLTAEGILLHKLRRGGHREQRRIVMFDWSILITIASIIGTIANIYKKRWCFIIWLFTNGFWCIYDISIGAYSQAILFAVYFMLAIHGSIKWRKDSAGESK